MQFESHMITQTVSCIYFYVPFTIFFSSTCNFTQEESQTDIIQQFITTFVFFLFCSQGRGSTQTHSFLFWNFQAHKRVGDSDKALLQLSCGITTAKVMSTCSCQSTSSTQQKRKQIVSHFIPSMAVNEKDILRN